MGTLTFWYEGDGSGLAFDGVSRDAARRYAKAEARGRRVEIVEASGTVTFMNGRRRATHATWSGGA